MTLTNEEIVELIKSYDDESKALKTELLRMCWFMRGGLSYEDLYTLSYEERKIVAEIVDKNLETTKESGLPFF